MTLRLSGALWRDAGFLRLWAAQAVSSFGARIAREGFAMAAILSIHATPAELGLLAALARGPGAVVGLFAGGFVDRSSRRQVMIACDLARTALILTVPVAAWMQLLSMPQLYAVGALVGAASVLFEIADHAFLPSLIQSEHLLEGNAKLGTTEAIAEIGGPAAAGTLFQLFTAPFAMLGTAITYLISAAFLFAVPARELPPPETRARWHEDLWSGLKAVLDEPLVRPLLWMTIVFTGFGAFFWPLYLFYGIEVLGLSPALMGVTIACGGVGALFGASLSNALTRRIGIGPTVWSGCFAYTTALLLVPLAHGPVWLAAAMLMAAQLGGDGFAMAFMIPLTSLRQAVLPRAMLGRTAALFSAVSGAMTVIGAAAGGLLGGWLGIRETLLISVAGMAAAPLFVLLSPLRRLKNIPS
ncbi:MAG TPA: MFS transporter [Rhizomicrobium sp.]|nr:MFS transporter [Rhizomicrobium sp.]